MLNFKYTDKTFSLSENVFTKSLFDQLKKEMSISKNGEVIMGGRINQVFTPEEFDRKISLRGMLFMIT